MPTRYWIAKNVDDVFRNETRNVGVIVSDGVSCCARFVGERETGVIDRRLLGQRFRYPEVYLQWIAYWRDAINIGAIDEVVSAKSGNYLVVEGGEVTDAGSDSPAAVCAFLFSLLVGDSPTMEAFGLSADEDDVRQLDSEVSEAFASMRLLSDGAALGLPHPIQRAQSVAGKHLSHEPSFSQRNGRLYVFEVIDFTVRRPKLIRERAGWMAYMYTDIRQREENSKAYSIYRPKADDAAEGVEYAKKMLEGESELVDWSNEAARISFLTGRRSIAESMAPG
jgi:hypothetical protein